MTDLDRRAPATDAPAPRAGAGRPRRLALAGLLVGLVALLLLAMSWAVTVGPASITVGQVWGSAWHHVCSALAPGAVTCAGDPLTAIQDAIVWQGRGARVVAAASVGAGLAVAGTVMQAVVRNPLADPYLLGVSSGASLGAVAVLVLGMTVLLPVAAFAGAVGALVLTLLLAAGRGGGLPPVRTVLAGVAVGQACSALVSFVIFWSATGDSYREILSWLLGSFGGITWGEAALAVGGTVVLGGLLASRARVLDAFAFGDVSASALGVHVRRERWLLLVVVTLLTAVLVSVCGSIGFVGLVVPHAVRLVLGSRNHRVMPVAALVGALFLLLADTAARTVFEPRELPVGILTAAIGAPVFAVLLRRSRL
ncbi:iron chelate uptake ABC transporter family permease subunit [Georgenia satyanarayanai]|uniref:iron chelate uptake ABC transporter family permease subunit n=1 Tax=Georgenia satyanarayanai TaxID=860221 RepID=UPI0038601C66